MASTLLALTPGPDNLFVLAQAAQRGKMAGIAVTGGLCTGLLVHTAAVALGVAAVFQASSLAFSLLKYIGAAYLLYLAWQSFRAGADTEDGSSAVRIGFTRLYGRGIVMNVTNPKVSLFFLAFLPQFTDPSSGPLLPQILALGLLFILSTVLIFGGISILAGGLGAQFRKSARAQVILNRLAGTVFVALAVKLALARR
ncbi:MAG: threonine transporter RhtB [Desulfobulbaceae bacterium BRH_c16a]|nr:MAG: threonine transporter RhtB [Desulfobulbaceae bacterium BRH_c16a]KJS02304.1 MAG: threonine transporter RhtB [Desulfobulbaceae bacterium BRH_c16a]